MERVYRYLLLDLKLVLHAPFPFQIEVVGVPHWKRAGPPRKLELLKRRILSTHVSFAKKAWRPMNANGEGSFRRVTFALTPTAVLPIKVRDAEFLTADTDCREGAAELRGNSGIAAGAQ